MIKPAKTSHLLRILADEIEKKEGISSEFILEVIQRLQEMIKGDIQ